MTGQRRLPPGPRSRGFVTAVVLCGICCATSADEGRTPASPSSQPFLEAPAEDAETGVVEIDDAGPRPDRRGADEDVSGETPDKADAGDVGESPAIKALLKRIDTLESAEKKRVAAEKKKAEDEKKKKEDDAKKKKEDEERKKAEDKRKAEAWQDMSNDKWTVKLGGHVQMDYINWADADPKITGPAAAPFTKDYFEFRRLRLVADGTGYGVLDFRLQMTLEPETVGETTPLGTVMSPDVKDAYLSMNEIPWLGRFRIGNFFVPFSLEQVTNDTNNIFMERSIPTQGIFAADREVGAALYNCTADQRVTWATGVFFDSISEGLKEKIDDNQGYRLSGRLTWLPYYDEPSNGRYLVHTGVGVLHTDDGDNRYRIRARPQIHEGPRLIDTGVLAVDHYTTGNIEAAVVWGPITVQSEAFLQQAARTDLDPVNFYGGYAHVSWFLTGESRVYERFGQHGAQFGRNQPISNFFLTPGGHGPGAWELKARWSNLNLDSVHRGRYNDLTVGCNWYWNDRTRMMFDWIHPVTSSQTTFGDTQSNLLATRFDFNW